MRYLCPKGHEGSVSFDSFKNKGTRCDRCARLASADKRRLSENDVRSRLSSLGITLVGKYVNTTTPLDCICKCGREITYYISQAANSQHCWKCRNEKMTGAANPSYNPEMTDEERALRSDRHSDAGYRGWRNSVYRRDFFTCQCCTKKRGIKIHAHHIENYSEHKDKRFDVDNGITLCAQCHRSFHASYGNAGNNADQIYEFIESHRQSSGAFLVSANT